MRREIVLFKKAALVMALAVGLGAQTIIDRQRSNGVNAEVIAARTKLLNVIQDAVVKTPTEIILKKTLILQLRQGIEDLKISNAYQEGYYTVSEELIALRLTTPRITAAHQKISKALADYKIFERED